MIPDQQSYPYRHISSKQRSMMMPDALFYCVQYTLVRSLQFSNGYILGSKRGKRWRNTNFLLRHHRAIVLTFRGLQKGSIGAI